MAHTLTTVDALMQLVVAQIDAAVDDSSPFYGVQLLGSEYMKADFRTNQAFIRINLQEWYEAPYQTQEMVEYDVVVLLECLVKPKSESIEDEDAALDWSTKIARALRDALENNDLGGVCNYVAIDKFQRGMSMRGVRFGVTILPIIINPVNVEQAS